MREHVVDESDMATEQEMMATERYIRAALTKFSPLPPTGFCYNCDEPLPNERKFCDSDCRDDWQARNVG